MKKRTIQINVFDYGEKIEIGVEFDFNENTKMITDARLVSDLQLVLLHILKQYYDSNEAVINSLVRTAGSLLQKGDEKVVLH